MSILPAARKHVATCHLCGGQFDTFRGGYYNTDTARYTCKKCGRGNGRAERGLRIGMRQTKAGMAIKLLCGLLFLSISTSPAEGTEWDIGYFLVCFVLGGAMIAWALLPWLKARREQKDLAERDLRAAASALQKAAEHAAAPKICKSCGATSTGSVCAYCGTKLD